MSHRFGSLADIAANSSGREGAVGNLVLKVRDWTGREDIGANGDTTYTPRFVNGGIGLAKSRLMSSRAILNTRDNGSLWSLDSLLNLEVKECIKSVLRHHWRYCQQLGPILSPLSGTSRNLFENFHRLIHQKKGILRGN